MYLMEDVILAPMGRKACAISKAVGRCLFLIVSLVSNCHAVRLVLLPSVNELRVLELVSKLLRGFGGWAGELHSIIWSWKQQGHAPRYINVQPLQVCNKNNCICPMKNL